MNIGIVGCGYVADFYAQTLVNYPEINVVAVTDIVPETSARFAAHHSYTVVDSLDDLLAIEDIQIVLNLSNPRSHFEINKKSLLAGKHVYSEKPLAMEFTEAEELVELASQKGLQLSGAPCNVFSETAQTIWYSLRQKDVGAVRLVYAELDDGLLHRMRYRNWHSASGSPWPYKDEFEVGCTLEHAAYYVTWLVAFFGPAKTITSFASCLIPDKETDIPLDTISPDFAVATIQFESGVVARLTCSIVAPHDHDFKIFGDDGVLSTSECWDYKTPVYLKRRNKLSLWAEKFGLLSKIFRIGVKKLPLLNAPVKNKGYRGTGDMDFARGVSEMASSIQNNKPNRLSANFVLHVNEIVLAMQHPEKMGNPRTLQSQPDIMPPMDWAKN